MIKKMKDISIIFIMTFIVLSCDKYSDYQSVIDNRSLDTVTIIFLGTTAQIHGIDTIISFPQTETIYYQAIGRMIRTKNHDCEPQILANEATVTSSSGRAIKKDISLRENWFCETNKQNSFWKMIFQISEADLE